MGVSFRRLLQWRSAGTLSQHELAHKIWSKADIFKGLMRASDYGKLVLPMVLLRRVDCVLEETKEKVLRMLDEDAECFPNRLPATPAVERLLFRETKVPYYNLSQLTWRKLMQQRETDLEQCLLGDYLRQFSANIRSVLESYKFPDQIRLLGSKNLLGRALRDFGEIDLGPTAITDDRMGTLFEELLIRVSESSNEQAKNNFTPRDVVRLMVELVFSGREERMAQPMWRTTVYDPAAGTGGMLSMAQTYLHEMNSTADLILFGQEILSESHAIGQTSLLIKGNDVHRFAVGNTLTSDAFLRERFEHMLSNPPFGDDWKEAESTVRLEASEKGMTGRFGVGLPRVSDSTLLFLLHMLSKMVPAEKGGSRIAIVMNGSPLFTGAAGSGESEIRRHILENDWLEAIIGLPSELYYNTGIATYLWILTNCKEASRKGWVQLIDASGLGQKMRKSVGSKRKELTLEDRASIMALYRDFPEEKLDGQPVSKIFKNADFGFRTITVERPLRDEHGNIILGQTGKSKGKPQPDVSLRDTENVPLNEDVEAYFKREVLPHVPDAWIDHDKTKVGYEIPFNRHFYVFQPPRPLEEIDADLMAVTERIKKMLEGLMA